MHQFDVCRSAIATAPMDNLNDSAFNEDTANTAAGINGAAPRREIGLNSFYRSVAGEDRRWTGPQFCRSGKGKELQFQVQAFNLFNHANLLRAERRRDQPVAIQPHRRPTVVMAQRRIRRAIWCPTRARAISEPSRKLAQAVFHASCSSPHDSRFRLSNGRLSRPGFASHPFASAGS